MRKHPGRPMVAIMGRNCAQSLASTCKPGRSRRKCRKTEKFAWTPLLQIGIPRRSSRGTRDLADSQRRRRALGSARKGGNHAAERLHSASARIWHCSQHGARRGARCRCCACRRVWHRPVGQGLHRYFRRHRAAATWPLCAQRRLSLRRRGRRARYSTAMSQLGVEEDISPTSWR